MIKNLIRNKLHSALDYFPKSSKTVKFKKLYNSFDYFTDKSLKNGDLFSYSIGTTAKEVMLRAKKLGGLLQYVPPNDPDYKFGNGGLTVRVIYPIK